VARASEQRVERISACGGHLADVDAETGSAAHLLGLLGAKNPHDRADEGERLTFGKLQVEVNGLPDLGELVSGDEQSPGADIAGHEFNKPRPTRALRRKRGSEVVALSLSPPSTGFPFTSKSFPPPHRLSLFEHVLGVWGNKAGHSGHSPN